MVFIGSKFWKLMLKENSDGSGSRGLWTIDGHGRPSDIHDTWKQWCSQTVLSSLCAYVVRGESWARPGHIKLPVMCENGLAKAGSVMPLSGDQW